MNYLNCTPRAVDPGRLWNQEVRYVGLMPSRWGISMGIMDQAKNTFGQDDEEAKTQANQAKDRAQNQANQAQRQGQSRATSATEKAKNQAAGMAEKAKNQAKGAVGKTGDAADRKTGGKFAGHVDRAQDKANDVIDGRTPGQQ